MRSGDVVAERFVIEAEAGVGGMATVYGAVDRTTGERVALKRLRDGASQHRERLMREARVLAELRHPRIVRYIAHGTLPDQTVYLVMEWLDGEDLRARLRRAGLSIGKTVALGRAVAEALAAAHAHGVVHRDVTPGNVFLTGGEIAGVKVLDFGIARWDAGMYSVTRSGLAIGTPGYMAPEQARGEREIDARADVYALGSVLFECLVGHAPFSGAQARAADRGGTTETVPGGRRAEAVAPNDVVGLLAKIVLEEAPSLQSARPDVPDALDELVARMLAKDPRERPSDGAAVASALAALDAIGGTPSLVPRARDSVLTTREQRLLSLILVGALFGNRDAAAACAEMDLLRAIAGAFGGRVESLLDGSLTVSFAGTGNATDQCAHAARCALALRSHAPEHPIVLATGRALLGARGPEGEAIDRATRLLGIEPPVPMAGHSGAVLLDDVTAGLLDSRFETTAGVVASALWGIREAAESSRTLLGRAMPFVGRDREMATLESLYAESVADCVARAVLVTAPAGVGKSGLRREWVQRRMTTTAGAVTPALLLGRGDPMRAGAPFGMIAPALRSACGIHDGEPLAMRRERLETRIARHLDPAHAQRVTDFLGEMIGVPSDHGGAALRAARQDARLMGDQIRRAWEDWLASECAQGPVLLVLEDLQWGDLPSAGLVDAALRHLHDRPLMVLALARPEVHDVLPGLWREREVQEMRLGELTRRAGEAMVRNVLGDAVPASQVERFVTQSGGNAFYLEEILRAVTEGRGDELPPTVLAMAQARLESVEPDARHVLRAASIFGRAFRERGVRALLGDVRAESLSDWLAELTRRELITRRGEARFAGDDDLVFRHDLVREAAYAMLTDADRTLGHRLAGAWLEAHGETESAVLAEHFERGGDVARSAHHYGRAAGRALTGNDLGATLAFAERALASGAAERERGALRLLEAEAHRWRGELALAEARGSEAMAELSRGDPRWYAAAALVMTVRDLQGQPERLASMATELCEIEQGRSALPAQVVAVARLVVHLLLGAQREAADRLLRWVEAALPRLAGAEPAAAAYFAAAKALLAGLDGDPAQACSAFLVAAASHEESGDLRAACVARMNAGFASMLTGSYSEAERELRDVLGTAERLGLAAVATSVRQNLGVALTGLGALDEARVMETRARDEARARNHPRGEGMSQVYLGAILSLAGELDAAERESIAAVDVLAKAPPHQAHALAALAQVRLLQARPAVALQDARRAMEILEALGGIGEGEALVRRVHAEALDATGDRVGACAAIVAARTRLLLRAERISDPTLRRSFLDVVPDHARTLVLAQEWDC